MTHDIERTREVFVGMLTENTGSHFLDSGGTYGRNWQRNQSRDFAAEPASVLSFQWKEIAVTHSVYHFLAERLSYSEKLDETFQAFCDEHPDECGRECIALFLDHLRDEGLTVAGIYGEGEPVEINTYNGEDLLSQTIQYTFATIEGHVARTQHPDPEDFENDDDYQDALAEWEESDDSVYLSGEYVFLQVHGGCDARGGYTMPRVFESTTELGIFDNTRGAIVCSNTDCGANWSTDDGCHWYRDGSCGVGAGLQLEECEMVTLPESCGEKDCITESDMIAAQLGVDIDLDAVAEDAYRFACREGLTGAIRMLESRLRESELTDEETAIVRLQLAELTEDPSCIDREGAEEDVLYVTEEGDGYCPECGCKLEASLY